MLDTSSSPIASGGLFSIVGIGALSFLVAGGSLSSLIAISFLSIISDIGTPSSPVSNGSLSLVTAGGLLSPVTGCFLSVVSSDSLSLIITGGSLSPIFGVSSFSTIASSCFLSPITSGGSSSPFASSLLSLLTGDGSLFFAGSLTLSLPNTLSYAHCSSLPFSTSLFAPRFIISLTEKRLFDKMFITQRSITSTHQ